MMIYCKPGLRKLEYDTLSICSAGSGATNSGSNGNDCSGGNNASANCNAGSGVTNADLICSDGGGNTINITACASGIIVHASCSVGTVPA